MIRWTLVALALVVFYAAYRSLSSGELYMKGFETTRDEKPIVFYLLVGAYFLFGAMLLYFAAFGKMEQ